MWRTIPDRFHLAHTVGPQGWSSTLASLARLGMNSPEQLAESPLGVLRHSLPQRLFPRVSPFGKRPAWRQAPLPPPERNYP